LPDEVVALRIGYGVEGKSFFAVDNRHLCGDDHRSEGSLTVPEMDPV